VQSEAQTQHPNRLFRNRCHQHATLNAHGLRVVGMDFLQMKDASQYSAIIMNPPFSAGAQHVLKAWEVLWDGEIAAIINAETVRNHCDRYRQRLVTLIEECGRVEFVQEAFGCRRTTQNDCRGCLGVPAGAL